MCGPIPMNLEVDIRQVFLELVSFYEIIIGKPQTPTSFERQGGGGWTFDHPKLYVYP